ncbi:MAG TPA: hypothetical protein PKA20_13980 [Burkholderiaceae bacterium]|nr:hypothetical protein [Burkholderiaceae bacterium]
MGNVTAITNLAMAPLTSEAKAKAENSKNGSGSWFEAMAAAWGSALDKQAATIEEMSAALEHDDTPSAITKLTAESMKMGFLSTSSHTSLSSVGEALSTMARKS